MPNGNPVHNPNIEPPFEGRYEIFQEFAKNNGMSCEVDGRYSPPVSLMLSTPGPVSKLIQVHAVCDCADGDILRIKEIHFSTILWDEVKVKATDCGTVHACPELPKDRETIFRMLTDCLQALDEHSAKATARDGKA